MGSTMVLKLQLSPGKPGNCGEHSELRFQGEKGGLYVYVSGCLIIL